MRGETWGVSPAHVRSRAPLPTPFASSTMNLPTERLVLAFGCGIAAVAYLYWTVEAIQLGLGWTSIASARAGVVLAGTALLALVLRAAARANPPPDP